MTSDRRPSREIDRKGQPRRAAGVRRFRPYPAYKDSGVEWLGEIPAHWDSKRLKYLAPISDERAFESTSNLPYVALEHIEPGTGKLLAETEAQAAEGTTSRFRPGDVLFGKLRPYLAKVLRPSFAGICSTEILVLRSNGQIDALNLAYQLLSPGFICWIDSMTYGTKMPRANPVQVADTGIAVPPSHEQRAIAAFLDRETAKVDALVAKKERLIELLQEKRTTLVTRAVTKGLDPNVPMRDSGVEGLGEIPAHWEVGALGRWWQVIDCKHRTVPFLDKGIALASIGEVQSLEVDLSAAKRTSVEEYRRMISGGREPRRGDVIYSRNATVGSAALVTTEELFCMGQDVSLIRAADQDQRFLVFLLRSPAVMGQLVSSMVGSTFNRINVSRIKCLVVCVPPLEEQREIAGFCHREHQSAEQLTVKIRHGIARLKEFRTALISAAVTGKIDVREEVPDADSTVPGSGSF